MARLPDPQLARQWRERLDRFEHSELTVAKFCEVEGYSTASFYQWRRKLRDEKSPGDPAFIPVQLNAGELLCEARRGFEIDLPGGATVKVLAWDKDGLSIWSKRLERGTFEKLTRSSDGDLEIDSAELIMMLRGVQIEGTQPKRRSGKRKELQEIANARWSSALRFLLIALKQLWNCTC